MRSTPASFMAAAYRSALRVSGTLVADATLRMSTGSEPRAWLVLQIQPPKGLAYLASIDLGTDVAEHMYATAHTAELRAGTVVSVGGDALDLATDHGHAALRVVSPRDVVIFGRTTTPLPTPTAQPQED